MVNSNNFEVRSKTEKGAAPSWLLSFGDLTAILTTFFVLLFSMSTPQSEKWQEFVPGLALSKSGLEREEPIPGKKAAPSFRERAPALPLGYLSEVLEETFKADPILKTTGVYQLQNSLIVSLPDEALFSAGEANLSNQAKKILFNLGGVISTLGNRIDIEGHSAPNEDHNEILASDWKLSLARALAVSTELEKSGYNKRLVVLGHGASQSQLLSKRYAPSWRDKLARRVNIIIHPEKGDFR